MATRRHFSGTPLEPQAGYCRALRVGDRILVSGTLGVDAEGRPVGDARGQAERALERIVEAVEALGGRRDQIVRTRTFATDPARDWPAFAAVHGAVFGEQPPVASFVGTSGLVTPGCVLEIEAEAVLAN